jgi:hypothetical protein
VALRQPDAGSRFRTDPIRVVLAPRPGVTPCAKPPVRIFLGTEDAQHRAERVFFYSIEKHRDPARTYEVHLMKNLAGFRRQGWRTGFTNYRYAIPELAGGAGRAIYNDVDQIYLTDPAELFDLEMGHHGYLAISPKDTSVMLVDCARMLPLWNRRTAATSGKAKLANEPAKTPGLWGRLDPGWNARDVEYVEGESKVLHYTALHQQPWHPFPEEYSYHPNPLAFLWHDLEREADAGRYQVFTRSAPSPDFRARMVEGATEGGHGATPIRPSGRAMELMAAARPRRVLTLALGGLAPPAELAPIMAGAEIGRLDLADAAAVWPEDEFDAVIATGVLDLAPSEDLPWLLDELLARARGWVYLGARAEAATFSAEEGGDAHCGRRTPEGWRTRVGEVGPHVHVKAGVQGVPGRVGQPSRIGADQHHRGAVQILADHPEVAADRLERDPFYGVGDTPDRETAHGAERSGRSPGFEEIRYSRRRTGYLRMSAPVPSASGRRDREERGLLGSLRVRDRPADPQGRGARRLRRSARQGQAAARPRRP